MGINVFRMLMAIMMNKGVIIWKRNEMGTNIMRMLINLRKYNNNDEQEGIIIWKRNEMGNKK